MEYHESIVFIFSVYIRALRQVGIPRETQVTSGIFHSYITRERCVAILCEIGQMRDGKNGCNTVEPRTAFLYSNWLNILWLDIKKKIFRCILVLRLRILLFTLGFGL